IVCLRVSRARAIPKNVSAGRDASVPLFDRFEIVHRLLFGVSFAALWLAGATCNSTFADKPNVVVISIDDLGYADIGPFGSEKNRTPHLDRMAAEGRKLTSFYAAPVCSPSRASLMTGCYSKRVLPIPGVLFPSGAVGLHPEEVTIADVLHDAGYATACIGKWHLGDQPEFMPTSQGFDSYLGIPYSNDMGTAADGSKSDLGKPIPDVKPPSPALIANHGANETGLKGNQQPPLPLVEDLKVVARVRQDEQQAIVETYTTAAVKFIRAHQDKPFFLYLPQSAVHFPIYPGKTWAGKSPHGYYSDWVEEVDWSVGQILDTLRELKLDQNTLVIFTSDNGGTSRGSNYPLRGFKASTWEGGMRVPTIAWWPGKIPANTSTDAVTGMIDLLPTLSHVAGAAIADDRKLDGKNIWPLLAGDPDAAGHETFYYYRGFQLEAVRMGKWKLHLGTGRSASEGKRKAVNRNSAAPPAERCLYDLAADIAESNNVYSDHPGVVAEIEALISATETDLGVTTIGPGCRDLGRVDNPEPWIHHDGSYRVVDPIR
ncbi:MAG: sulfatase, partial [Planctomycetaceae bacterium]